MKIAVKILPKPEVLDTQGRTVKSRLLFHGFDLSECHIGKYIVLEIPAKDIETAKKRAKAMVEKALYNPLIENYQIEVLENPVETRE